MYCEVFSRTSVALQEIQSETLSPSYFVNILHYLVNIAIHKIPQIVVRQEHILVLAGRGLIFFLVAPIALCLVASWG